MTLACCGGFLDVADFLIKAGADIELGASTPLMEAAQGKKVVNDLQNVKNVTWKLQVPVITSSKITILVYY